MLEFEIGYLGLFITCFLAATILPITSELFLGSMLAYGYDLTTCLIIATIGNTLGGWLNYLIGMAGNPNWLKKIGVKQEQISRWEEKIKRYGSLLALLSWLPFVGDVIAVALGFFRVNWLVSFAYILIGKFLRYLFVVIFFL
ncbi:MAG: DedA family protein [Bacteroidetes bacterium]|nr:DedA family protein [Bacteroidota bacterium]